MSVSVSDLKIIASNGGGMILDATKFSSSDLKILASNASKTQAQIVLRKTNKLDSSDLKIIASNGKGCVVFDFYDI
jgi:hypothetical protein